ncbi:transposase [Natrinema hispanicum]|uniref:Transposase and inactivated derivatives, IS5 family n=1 Tax=Natrinema hispanicum TaxID=392421 RepID=A0A1I0IG57_9EURY|nr:transposase [Natrinema hispanicum]SET95038.1 Transposase and inactivated derivatives, IS5 family [Natrinema hispanicum]
MAVALLDLVEKVLRVAKQALGNHAGKPESGGLPREAHIVAHCIRKEEGHTFTELVDRLGLMPEVCDCLGIHPEALPDPTTFYHSLDRYAMYVWRALLRVSEQQLRQSGHVALDSTFFDRDQPSQYYLQRQSRTVTTVKATTLTDIESLAVLDVHCCIEREHDTKAGPRVVRRNADDLRAVVADNGFQDWHTEYELSAYDLDYRVHHRGSKPMAVAHNALNQTNSYTQRWMVATSYSTTKRTQASALRSRFWYRQFREIVLMFALHNIKKTATKL